MHMTLMARLACTLMVPLMAMMGWLFHAFLYELDASSPLIPMGFMGTLCLAMQAVWSLTEK